VLIVASGCLKKRDGLSKTIIKIPLLVRRHAHALESKSVHRKIRPGSTVITIVNDKRKQSLPGALSLSNGRRACALKRYGAQAWQSHKRLLHFVRNDSSIVFLY
jgi:hypothetical protein